MKKTLFASTFDVFLLSIAIIYYTGKLCWYKRWQATLCVIALVLLLLLIVSFGWAILLGAMLTFMGVGIYLLFFFNEFEDIDI